MGLSKPAIWGLSIGTFLPLGAATFEKFTGDHQVFESRANARPIDDITEVVLTTEGALLVIGGFMVRRLKVDQRNRLSELKSNLPANLKIPSADSFWGNLDPTNVVQAKNKFLEPLFGLKIGLKYREVEVAETLSKTAQGIVDTMAAWRLTGNENSPANQPDLIDMINALQLLDQTAPLSGPSVANGTSDCASDWEGFCNSRVAEGMVGFIDRYEFLRFASSAAVGRPGAEI